MERCPVCGTELYEDREMQFTTMHLGRQYRFCSEDHRNEFDGSPGDYT